MLNLNPYLKKLNNHSPLLFNLVLWFCAFVILLFIFSKGQKPIKIDYIYTIGFLISVAIPVLINLYIIIPRLLKKEKYLLFALAFIINLILFTQLHIWLFEPLLDNVFPNYFFMSYLSNTRHIIIFSIFLISTTLLKLSEDWFYFNQNENKALKSQNELIQTQLSSLRSQINPHFLFNSLNVIYSLAIQKKDNIKDAVVQLSDILRYVIYDSNTERVTLKEEITLLKNYIEFQKFRVQGFNNINLKTTIEDEGFKIYPMLLLPLIENSFKHGIKGNLEETFINISMKQKENSFSFKIENNTLDPIDNASTEASGLGLENIKKNLDIVYPNNYTFIANNSNNIFSVKLTINNQE